MKVTTDKSFSPRRTGQDFWTLAEHMYILTLKPQNLCKKLFPGFLQNDRTTKKNAGNTLQKSSTQSKNKIEAKTQYNLHRTGNGLSGRIYKCHCTFTSS